jgi:hypothetical protein
MTPEADEPISFAQAQRAKRERHRQAPRTEPSVITSRVEAFVRLATELLEIRSASAARELNAQVLDDLRKLIHSDLADWVMSVLVQQHQLIDELANELAAEPVDADHQ